MSTGILKIIAYLLLLVLIAPIILFTYFVQQRLLILAPIILYTIFFYSGVLVKGDREVQFEIELVDE